MIYYTDLLQGWDLLCKSYYNSEICKNHFQIVEPKKKKKWNDMATDVAQPEHNSIKCYVLAFSNIQIIITV